MRFLVPLSICLFVLLQGCAVTPAAQQLAPAHRGAAVPARYFDVDIPTHDGKTLTATLYQPKLAAGETAPLIIQTHGFGGFRTSGPWSLYGKLVISGEAAIAAWHAGYWVLSYDQRGFGDSGGKVHLMAPQYEVRDMSDVIDWSDAHLPRVSRDRHGGMRIGTLGESYGGGVQILDSMRDPRIDAIVPIATWYDMANILAPNGHVKAAWASWLIGLGTFDSDFDFPMAYQKDYLRLLGGSLNPKVARDLALRSPRTYCERGQSIHADALFIQGFRDALMPVNEAYKNLECARRGGRDARLIAIQDGHILPWPVQSWSGMPLFNTQSTIVCGKEHFRTTRLILQWFDEKLKGKRFPHHPIPQLCTTFSDHDGEDLKALPQGGTRFAVRKTRVKLVQSGMLEVLLSPLDEALGWLPFYGPPQPAADQPVSGGWLRPAFIPLKVIHRPTNLLGIPEVNLRLKTTTHDHKGVAFIAIGVRPEGTPHLDILDEQYTPLPGDGHYRIKLPALARHLHRGDTLGLVVQGFTGQYYFDPDGWLSTATIRGFLRLPLASPPGPATAPASVAAAPLQTGRRRPN